MVEEIMGRLPELSWSQLGRLEDELWRERQRRASSAGDGGQDASHVQDGAAPPVTEVLEYRPREDGYLQLEVRRYVRLDGSARERSTGSSPSRASTSRAAAAFDGTSFIGQGCARP